MGQGISVLGTELDELEASLQIAFAKLKGIEDGHFQGVTRANIPNVNPADTAKIDEIAASFTEASRTVQKMQKIANRITGAQPKLS